MNHNRLGTVRVWYRSVLLMLFQEMEKLQSKLEKNAKDRAKLEKAGKGSFKFRLSPGQIEERRLALDQALDTLQAQRKLLDSLRPAS